MRTPSKAERLTADNAWYRFDNALYAGGREVSTRKVDSQLSRIRSLAGSKGGKAAALTKKANAKHPLKISVWRADYDEARRKVGAGGTNAEMFHRVVEKV